MAALREIFATFGVQFDDRQLKRGAAQTQALTNKVRELGRFLAVGFIVRGAARFVSSTIAMGDELDKTARQLGLTTTELQAFSHAASLGGVDSAAFAMSVGQLQRNAHMASQGTGEAADAFRDLGVEFQDTNGELLSGADLMRNVADGLQNTSNSSTRTALAMMLMGRSGRRLLPMLEGGSEGLSTMTAELERLGGGASQDFIDQSVEITDNLARWRLAMQSLKSGFLLQFLPGLNRAVGASTEWIASLAKNEGATKLLITALGLLAAAAVAAAVKSAVAWIAAGWPILLVALFVGILALAVQDLWATWNGGDSITRRFINEIWPGMVDGLDSTDRAILAITEAIADLIVGFGNLVDAAQPIADILLSAFRPLLAMLGAVQDLSNGMGIGRTMSRAAGRLTHGGVLNLAGALGVEDPEAAAAANRRAASQEGLGRIGQRITRGRGRRERSMAESMLPEHLQRVGLGNQRRVNSGNQTVNQSIQVDINADGIQNPDEVMAIARREMRDELGRHARQLQAQLVPQTQSATGFEWDDS